MCNSAILIELFIPTLCIYNSILSMLVCFFSFGSPNNHGGILYSKGTFVELNNYKLSVCCCWRWEIIIYVPLSVMVTGMDFFVLEG